MNVVLEWVMGMPSAQAGAIDVIAVRKTDGTISCSPFHVKLGKASKKGEKKIVKLKVNGKAVDLSMKLGPAGEAFFVERTREFPRRELNSSYPGSPYGEGAGIDSAGPMSPRDEADVASPVVTGELEAVDDQVQNQNLPTSMGSHVPSSVVTESASPLEAAPTLGLLLPRVRTASARARSLSEGDAFAKQAGAALPHSPVPAPISVRARATTPAADFPDASLEGTKPHGRRARAASDMSELLGACQRAIHITDTTVDGGHADSKAAAAGASREAPEVSTEVAPNAGSEESSVAWMWRWGTLPVKKKPKVSTGDLQALSHAHPTAPTAPADDAAAPARSGSGTVTVDQDDLAVGAVPSGSRSKDTRGRAVSLPSMFPSMVDDGSGTAHRKGRGLGYERNMQRRAREMGLQQTVTAVETDIPFSRTAQDPAEAQEFARMFEMASKDASTFHALSLCGHLLLGLDADEPRSPAALRNLLHTHLITPKDIVTSGVLGNPDLVVILGDFLLPIAAAERLLAAKKSCAAAGTSDPESNTATSHVSPEEVAAALAEISSNAQAALPVWAGRRISQWSLVGSDAVAEGPASEEHQPEGSTPFGALHWKESFSDLVQAYRVQSISDLHSSGMSGTTAERDSYAVSPLLQEFFPPGAFHTSPYRGLWRTQLSASREGSSFTALIELDSSGLSHQEEAGRKLTGSEDAQDRDYGVGFSLHPERLSDASSSHHSLPMLLSMEALHEEHAAGPAGSPPSLSPPHSGATYMREALPRIPESERTAGDGSATQASLGEEGDTDNDNLSIQDIDFDDISPEPAGGDFYDSDTDSYLSMSLEDGEPGSASASSKAAFRGVDMTSASAAGSMKTSDSVAADASGPQRRRFRKYRYRKVLVPSQEQLEMLDLQDGPNDIVFELEGCTPLKSCLFVWPADAKVVVTDLEGVFSRQQSNRNSGVWISFLGGGSYYSSAVSKTEFDSCIRLFATLSRQGYRIIYLAQGTQSSATTAAALLSSQEYLASFKATTGERLPAGPVFRSPDSLVRAFGAARTEVFKASALRGVKSLFPVTHNPYHACFCVREGDAIPFARFGFPEGRIFMVSDKGVIRSANRTCTLSFPKITELLHQIFPQVIDSQSVTPLAHSAKDNQSNKTANCTDGVPSTTSTTSVAQSPRVADAPDAAAAATKPSSSASAAPAAPAAASREAVVVTTAAAARALRTSTDDTYNDFNFWKIPPAILEDEY